VRPKSEIYVFIGLLVMKTIGMMTKNYEVAVGRWTPKPVEY